MTIKFVLAITIFTLASAEICSADSITTTFSSNNSENGNMFDLTTFGNGLTITALDLNVDSAGRSFPFTVEVYTKPGSYVGSQLVSGDWTLRSSDSVNAANDENTPTFVDIADFMLDANSLTGVYVTLVDPEGNGPFLAYTNGTNSFNNADLQLDLGDGIEYAFGGIFGSRIWNGTIYYTLEDGQDGQGDGGDLIPEPSTLAIWSVLGALCLCVGWWQKRQGK